MAGDVRLVQGFTATGEVRLLAMRLGGSLDLTAAALLPRNLRALDVAEATVNGSVFILDDPDLRRRPRIHGRIEMGRTVVNGRVLLRNADLHAPPEGAGHHDYNPAERGGRPVLLAPRLTVHGEFAVETETVVHGGLLLAGADLKGGLRIDAARLWNPGGVALDLSQATLGAGLRLTDGLVEGTVSVANARIDGPLDVGDTRLRLPGGDRCLDGVGVVVEGDIRMAGLDARGGSVNLRGCRVAGVVEAERAVFDHPAGKTLSLHQARVSGNVRLCDGFTSTGVVVLTRAVVDGRLRCDGARLAWPGPPSPANRRGAAVEAISATFRGGVSLGWHVGTGAVDLTDAQTSFLADRPGPGGDWPATAYVSGFTYQRFAPPDGAAGPGEWDAGARIRWLSRLEPYTPDSWEQVARVLRANGDPVGAERVLIARRRHARRRAGLRRRPLRYAADVLLDALVGYGHRPHRALAALFVLVAVVAGVLAPAANQARMRTTAGTVVYSPLGPVDPAASARPAGRCGGGSVRCFNPVLYAIDTVVPVIDLKQRSTWYPDAGGGARWLEWLLNACTVLGWAASTVFVLSFARLGRAGSG